MRSGSNEGPIIEVKDLSVKYHSRDHHAIRDISFSIERGNFVWLAGDSASGKSTVMNALCGFIPHIIPADVEGTVVFDGKKDMNSYELARRICMVHQDPEAQFCTERVEDEIAFGLENYKTPRKEIDRRIDNVLKLLNCSHLRDRKLHTLSGGEKQKIAVASMLVLDPEVLILDEPTSNLDAVSMEEVLSAIKSIRKNNPGLSIILAEHRIGGLMDHVDSMIKLDDGEIVEDIQNFQSMKDERKEELADYSYPDYQRKRMGKNTQIVQIKDLTYKVGGKTILESISTKIEQGEIVALMGRNGSGKTTLINHISGLTDVQQGKIKVFDHLMSRKQNSSPWDIGGKVGYVFQNPNHQIFENTVEDEMLFGPKNFSSGISEAKKKIDEITKKENIEKETHPHTLSFGQKRRLNVHSSSGHDPELLIIDEPFSGQDHANALAIAELLDEHWKKGKTLIIVTHDLEFAKKFCTRSIVLKEGKIIYDGRPQDLKNIEGETEDA